MKNFKVVLVVLLLCSSVMAFSQRVLTSDSFSSTSKWTVASGSWKTQGGRLVQTNDKETIAVINIPARQSGEVLYEFDARYVSGGEDDYAGFGIHICVNNPSKGRSWGTGKSLLAWVTWDPNTYGWPGGFIQVYQSKGPVEMNLYPYGDIIKDGDWYPINEEYLKYEYLEYTVPVKMSIDLSTGAGKFYDPFDPDNYYYAFDLGAPIPAGSHFSFRMNSVSLSLDNLKITKLR
jgi:hypothetical protein